MIVGLDDAFTRLNGHEEGCEVRTAKHGSVSYGVQRVLERPAHCEEPHARCHGAIARLLGPYRQRALEIDRPREETWYGYLKDQVVI